MNVLKGILRYLIGANEENVGAGRPDEITLVPYKAKKVRNGISIAYGNLFDEENTGKYGPYLKQSDTARQYNEGQISPAGDGWYKNLRDQCTRIRDDGFGYMELDNPDSYNIRDVTDAIEYAKGFNIGVIAKNAGLCDLSEGIQYIKHENIFGCIVEKDCGRPNLYEYLRKEAKKPTLPIWFVTFGGGERYAHEVAESIEENHYINMGGTFSPKHEYTTSVDIFRPFVG